MAMLGMVPCAVQAACYLPVASIKTKVYIIVEINAVITQHHIRAKIGIVFQVMTIVMMSVAMPWVTWRVDVLAMCDCRMRTDGYNGHCSTACE